MVFFCGFFRSSSVQSGAGLWRIFPVHSAVLLDAGPLLHNTKVWCPFEVGGPNRPRDQRQYALSHIAKVTVRRHLDRHLASSGEWGVQVPGDRGRKILDFGGDASPSTRCGLTTNRPIIFFFKLKIIKKNVCLVPKGKGKGRGDFNLNEVKPQGTDLSPLSFKNA